MDVLIVERDELIGSMLADTLDAEGIPVEIVSDEGALKLPPDNRPHVVITSINRGHSEDLRGLALVSAMRRKWPRLCVIYLAAVWPLRLRREGLAASERFLAKPVLLTQLIRTVRNC